jgi:hypothetical protein
LSSKIKIAWQLGFNGENLDLKNPTLKEIFTEIDVSQSCQSSMVIKIAITAKNYSNISRHHVQMRERNWEIGKEKRKLTLPL